MVFPMLISNTCYIDEFRSYLRNSFFFSLHDQDVKACCPDSYAYSMLYHPDFY